MNLRRVTDEENLRVVVGGVIRLVIGIDIVRVRREREGN